MQVGNYPTRDFATFEPSELQLPFTNVYNLCVNINNSHISTGQVSDPILHIKVLQSPVFLINSRPLQFCNINNTDLKHRSQLFDRLSNLNYIANLSYPEVTRLICRIPSVSFF